jgi:hypothetical protein
MGILSFLFKDDQPVKKSDLRRYLMATVDTVADLNFNNEENVDGEITFVRGYSVMGDGFKSLLAREFDCETAYVTKLFRRQASLSPDQAEIVNRVCKHDSLASDIFC